MSNQVTGQIVSIGEIETKGDKFSKRIIVIQTEEKFSQKLPIELHNEYIREYSGLKVGDMITASINIRSNEWKEKLYVQLKAWNIKKNN